MNRPVPAAPDVGFVEAVDGLIERAATSPAGHLLTATVPLPDEVDPLVLWDVAASEETAIYWDATDETVAGLGRVTYTTRLPGEAEARLRRYGGLPFDAGDTDESWGDLPGVGFVLPRWTIRQSGAGATLELRLGGSTGTQDAERIRSERSAIADVIASPPRRASDRIPVSSLAEGAEVNGRGAWNAAVDEALADIDSGELEKVVLARRIEVPLPRELSAADILRRLRAEHTGRFRFGLRHGGRAFVGASPECLFLKDGDTVEIEALAGTFDLGSPVPTVAGRPDLVRAAEHLFASGKDLEEHALVVRGVLDALAPLAVSTSADEWPQVRQARGLAHLSTTVRGRLRTGVQPFDLISALHPTPAVGGLPRDAALAFIRRVEGLPRGLFSAPVGWIDENGDACLAVGIRSALVVDGRAFVYAGAGIVAASDPAAEWEETTAKLRWLSELLEDRR